MNRLLAIVCLMCCTPGAKAQADSTHHVQRAVMLGAGVANTYDTYLSPLEYRGPQMTVMRESLRMTHWRNIATQGLFQLSGTYTHNRAENGKEMGAQLNYRQTWYYIHTFGRHWHLGAGGGAGALTGVLYNMRNTGNNPAQAQVDIWLHAAIAARYTHKWLAVSAQLQAPLVGLMFAPHYGESYYEMFILNNNRGMVVPTHPVNCPTLRAQAHIDFKLQRGTMRIGYGADILQATPHNLRRHTYMHTGYIGFVRHFRLIK